MATQGLNNANDAPPAYPELDAPPAYDAAAPPYANDPANQVLVAQPQPAPNAQPQVVYVVRPQPQQQPYTNQPVMEGVPTNNNTVVPSAVVVQQPMSIAAGIETGGDPNEYFRRKLNDPRVSCCCGQPGCCNMWMGAQIWLVLWIVGNLFYIYQWVEIIQFVEYARSQGVNVGEWIAWIYILFISDVTDVIANVLCFVGLYQCKPNLLLFQVVVILVTSAIQVAAIIFMNEMSPWVLVDVLLSIFVAWIFYTVYKWAKYFRSGGPFDPNQLTPPDAL